MNKADLAAAVRGLHGGLSGAQSLRIVDTIFRIAAEGLVRGNALRIRNFGSLEVRSRRPRRGRDPRTGRIFISPAHRTPFFRPSAALFRRLPS